MNFLSLPPELRDTIYRFCCPLTGRCVQLIPYYTHLTICRLNLPLNLYLVCKQTFADLPPLQSLLRSLDFLYLIQGYTIDSCWYRIDGSRDDEDPDLYRFRNVLQSADRVRLVGSSPHPGYPVFNDLIPLRSLIPGPKCGLRSIEVQPCLWTKNRTALALTKCLMPVTTHPDVAEHVKFRLVRNLEGGEAPMDDTVAESIEELLRHYEGLDASQRGG